MTATLNASTSSGVIVTSDTSGNLAIQSNGTTIATVASTGTTLANTTTITTLSDGTNSTSSTNPIRGSAKVWLNFNATGSILGSFNVSSVTRNSAGSFTVNFTTALTDANYAPVFTVGYTGNVSLYAPIIVIVNSSQLTIYTSGASSFDPTTCGLAVFR